jgi:hypothetical protein
MLHFLQIKRTSLPFAPSATVVDLTVVAVVVANGSEFRINNNESKLKSCNEQKIQKRKTTKIITMNRNGKKTCGGLNTDNTACVHYTY